MKTPAELGIEASQEQARIERYMSGLCDEFKTLVMDSIAEGHYNIFDDHFKFMKACLEMLEDLHEEA